MTVVDISGVRHCGYYQKPVLNVGALIGINPNEGIRNRRNT
jgi:hypothetical protein